MAKEVIGLIKLQLPAGKANPAPPVGPALGQHGVNIMEFCKAFNAKTQDKAGWITPPASDLLKKAAGIQSGAQNSKKEVAGKINTAKLREIAETKMPDLNAGSVEAAMNIIAGSARSMGIKIED